MLKIKGKSIVKYIEIAVVVFMLLTAVFIAYLSFNSGTKDSRDTKRLADLLSIHDGLKVFYSKNNLYPTPELWVNITSSWEILTSQWYFWESLFSLLQLSEIKDPLWDDNFQYLNYYTYATNAKKNKIQLGAFLELDTQVTYNPLASRKLLNYGDKVWIAIEEKMQRPIQETKLSLDILHTQDQYSIYFDDKTKISWDSSVLKVLVSQTLQSRSISCKEIKDAGVSESGYYYINPLVWGAYEKFGKVQKVYCDMESDGWGWTRLYYKNGKETCINDGMSYNKFMLEKLFTKDIAVSDNIETLQTQGSWILHDVDFKNKDFDYSKMTNVANCKTPLWGVWNMEYWQEDENGTYSFLMFIWKLQTLWNWKQMFYWCGKYVDVDGEISLRIWGRLWHTGEFISSSCNDYSDKDNSITSRWDWDNTRVIWVR